MGVQEGGGNERGEGMSKRQEESAEREEARPLAWGIVSGERSRPAVGVVGGWCVCGCVGVLGQGVRKATKRPKRVSVSDREQGQGLTH